MKHLAPVVQVIEENCVNCHACIAACPVKFCNDGSQHVVKLNPDACIGCGECVDACAHEARVLVDDTDRFLSEVGSGVKMVAVVAPAVATNFPDRYLNVNGWLKSLGVEAVFDVSFGAELTVKSYLEHLRQNKPTTVIAQPCPAIVTYIEIYRPELLPYLAPADSPMLHTIRMVREFYPQYRHHKVAVLSPCAAKRREFDETGLGDYNVTFARLQKHFDGHQIRLDSFAATEYDNPPAERAVLFSTPGGLMRTAMREVPGIEESVRKIEGTHVIYKYLDALPRMIAEGKSPLMVDCLNCELGCNAGVATTCRHRPQDEIEWLVEQRSKKARATYAPRVQPQDGSSESSGKSSDPASTTPVGPEQLYAFIEQHWKPGLYARTYEDLSANVALKMPSEATIAQIYRDQLRKETKAEELNCGGCGYGACRRMAVALHNGLTVAEHCTLLKQKKLRDDQVELRRIHEEQATVIQHIQQVAGSTNEFQVACQSIADNSHWLAGAAQSQTAEVENVSGATEALSRSVEGVREIAEKAERKAKQTSDLAQQGGTSVQKSVEAMHRIHESSNQIGQIIQVVSDIARQTNLLALNAAIEAARAGQHGLGFAVVADEVRRLAERSNQAAHQITGLVKESTQRVGEGEKLSEEAGKALSMILDAVQNTVVEIEQIAAASAQQATNAEKVARAVDGISKAVEETAGRSNEMAASSQALSTQAAELRTIVARLGASQGQVLTHRPPNVKSTERSSIGKVLTPPRPFKAVSSWTKRVPIGARLKT